MALRGLTEMQAMSPVQVSMSGISVSEDAVNLFYYMKAKSTVRPASCAHAVSMPPLAPGHAAVTRVADADCCTLVEGPH